jgi:mannan endo-1,4-beta-mannosidase
MHFTIPCHRFGAPFLLIALLFMFFFIASCTNLSPIDAPIYICNENNSPAPLLNKERFGFFAPELYTDFSGHLDSLTRTFGASSAYMLWFLQIDDPFPSEKIRYAADRGIRTVISMNIRSQSPKIDAARNDTLLEEIGHGTWDSTLTAFARAAAALETIVYLRFGYEMNGNWFSWGGKPAAFVVAWTHAHVLFGQTGASNVRWIFAPGVLWDARTAQADLYPYYPGDSVVDAIGLDGYNFGDSFDKWHSWKPFTRVFGESLRAIADMGKPIWITEVGCPSDARRPGWLTGLFAFMDDNPCVEAMLWFNAHKTGEPDYRLESDSASLAMVREWLQR